MLAKAAHKSKKKKLAKAKVSSKTKSTATCRICCKRNASISIFGNTVLPNVVDEIKNFSGVVIVKSDTLSNSICRKCMELLKGCIKFRDLCQRNNSSYIEVPVKQETRTLEDSKLELEYQISDYCPSPFPPINNDDVMDNNDDVTNNDDGLVTEPNNGGTPWFCKQCKYSFLDIDAYHDHLPCVKKPKKAKKKKDLTKQPALCEICGKTLTTPQILMVHMTTHSNIFPFKCDSCPYQGRTRNLLLTHMRSHMSENERPYKCTQCPKATATASNLLNHMRRMHSTEKPYKCTYCEKSFVCQTDLKKHIRDIHLRQDTVDCEICFKTFSNKKYLKRHLWKIHKLKAEKSHLPNRLPSYLQYKSNVNTEPGHEPEQPT